jgi:hypothetical protein
MGMSGILLIRRDHTVRAGLSDVNDSQIGQKIFGDGQRGGRKVNPVYLLGGERGSVGVSLILLAGCQKIIWGCGNRGAAYDGPNQ